MHLNSLATPFQANVCNSPLQLKAMKGKENYAKKLEEMMTTPDSVVEDDILPDMNYSKSAKRFSRVCCFILAIL